MMIFGSENGVRAMMSGEDRTHAAAALRGAAGFIEPVYAWMTYAKNRLYDAGQFKISKLPHPTISIGNLTTGGTGKTPMVRWLANRLRSAGRHVAVLSRGYKSKPNALGDEQVMLGHLLNAPHLPQVTLVANPDRVAGADSALRQNANIDTFLLDDGFQHRRVFRDLDILLINAVEPFGYGHILPRGMLRESVDGIDRAGAVVITHADQVDESRLLEIEQVIKKFAPEVPVCLGIHSFAGVRTSAVSTADKADKSLPDLSARRFFAFAGIGSPHILQRQLEGLGGKFAGHRWFADHHAYTASDLASLRDQARQCDADVFLTTEKDWAKVSGLKESAEMEIWRLDVELQFLNNSDRVLIEHVQQALQSRSNAVPVNEVS